MFTIPTIKNLWTSVQTPSLEFVEFLTHYKGRRAYVVCIHDNETGYLTDPVTD